MREATAIRSFVCAMVAVLLVLVGSGVAPAQQKWGTIKGQVVYGGPKVPEPLKLVVNQDANACLAKQKQLLSQEWIVDADTKGVKWVAVWLVLADAKTDDDLIKAIPVHPDLVKKKLPDVVVDQPCCMFEPYMIPMQDGQKLIVKNSMTVPHNINIKGREKFRNPMLNQIIQPGGSLEDIPLFHAQPTPIPIECNIHTWMKGYIVVCNHPYLQITDKTGKFEIKNAPAGKYRLVIWHEGAVFVVGEKDKGKFGIPIEIKADETTDLGLYKAMPPVEDKKDEKK